MRQGPTLLGAMVVIVVVAGCEGTGHTASLETDEPTAVRSLPTAEERLCAGKVEGRYEVREADGWVTEYGCRGGRFHGGYAVSRAGVVWVRGVYRDGVKIGVWEMRGVDGTMYTRRYIDDVPVY